MNKKKNTSNKKKVVNNNISLEIIEDKQVTTQPEKKRKGAPLGNQYWRDRFDMSVDGRKLSVEELKTKILEYIERCTGDRLYSLDWVGKDAKQVERPHMIAMSVYGACVHIGIASVTWRAWRKDEKYSSILLSAEDVFKAYNVEGSAAGMLNQSIIARIENLSENVDVTSAGEKISTTVVVQDAATKGNLDKLIESEKK